MTIADLSGGGAEREFVNLASCLDRRVFDIHACLWRPVFDYPLPEDVPATILHKHKPWHVFRTVSRLARLIDELKPDVVFSVLQYTNLVTGSALGRCRHSPRWACRFVLPPEITLRGINLLLARRVLPRADRLLGCSEGVAHALVRRVGIDPRKALALRNPVDLERIAELAAEPLPIEQAGSRFTVVTVGRLTRQKNQGLLLRAFAQLPENSELWIIGRGELETPLKHQAQRLGIEPRVRWLGFQKNPFPFISAADCFALSSEWEGLPTVIIEAMACGTPVVSTRCPYGPDELIANGETGMLVPMNDPAALAAALTRLAAEPGLRAKLAQNAGNAVRSSFSGLRTVEEHARLFQELAEGE